MSNVRIRFLSACGAYNGGEIAGFDADIASEYVKRGIAEYLTTEVKSAPVDKMMSAPAEKKSDETVEEKPKEEKPKKKLLRRRSTRRRSQED